MNHTINIQQEVPVRYLFIEVPVRYGDEDISDDFPLRDGDMWRGTVDLDTHKILEWPQGESGEMQMKVCDEGTYILMDENKKEVAAIRRDYVPNDAIPGEWGDYIYLKIDETGRITNWMSHPDFNQFETQY